MANVLNGWCVYVLRDEAGKVRYIGKGKPGRVQVSARERKLDYELVSVNLDEQSALALEERLITAHAEDGILNVVGTDNPRARGSREREGVTPDQIKDLRARLGITQDEAGRLLGSEAKRSRGTWNAWESGYRTPSGAALMLLMLLDARPEVLCWLNQLAEQRALDNDPYAA